MILTPGCRSEKRVGSTDLYASSAAMPVSQKKLGLEIQVAQLDDQLRKCHITSPICGTVLAKYAEAGELATQGKPLFKVADVQHLFARLYHRRSIIPTEIRDKVKCFSDLGKMTAGNTKDNHRISDKSEFTLKQSGLS